MTDPKKDVLNFGSDDEKDKPQTKTGRNRRAPKNQQISTTHTATFNDLHLKEELIRATGEAGFENPSEVQCEGIPYIILGKDMLCQAKSGMGKTAVFVLGVLQSINLQDSFQALILCHTRELAFQISKEFERLGKFLEGLKIGKIFGGLNTQAQELQLLNNPPQVVVGTPGRTAEMVRKNKIKVDNLKFFIIDECDKVLEKFDMRQQIQSIFTKTNRKKQVLMFTATLNDKIKVTVQKFMKEDPKMIVIDKEQELTLHGLQQFFIKVEEKVKIKILLSILQKVQYDQVIIFVSKVERAKFLNKILNKEQLPSISLHRDMQQMKRLELYGQFKKGDKRILVATDLMARGIDIERVNLVVNYDMPETSDTYLHRVGRAGRYKTKGNSISFVLENPNSKDVTILEEIQKRFVVKIEELKENFDAKKLALQQIFINHYFYYFFFNKLTQIIFIYIYKLCEINYYLKNEKEVMVFILINLKILYQINYKNKLMILLQFSKMLLKKNLILKNFLLKLYLNHKFHSKIQILLKDKDFQIKFTFNQFFKQIFHKKKLIFF